MRKFVKTDTDNGAVHSNAGMPNRAFYLVATALGGFAWERAGRLWYERLSVLSSRAKFVDFAKSTAYAARRLYGNAGDKLLGVRHAWEMVGVKIDN